MLFGAGVGWMEEEFRALKVPFAERGALSDESLRIIRDIWTHGVVNHQGTFYQYEDMQASPHPVQQPGPPIWIGGNSARARRRVAEFGDGWHTSSLNAAAMAPGCAHLRELWEKHGRQGQPVFSARTDLAIEGVSDTVLSSPPRPGRPPGPGPGPGTRPGSPDPRAVTLQPVVTGRPAEDRTPEGPRQRSACSSCVTSRT